MNPLEVLQLAREWEAKSQKAEFETYKNMPSIDMLHKCREEWKTCFEKSAILCHELRNFIINHIDFWRVDERSIRVFLGNTVVRESEGELAFLCWNPIKMQQVEIFDLEKLITAIQSKGKVSYFDIINNKL